MVISKCAPVHASEDVSSMAFPVIFVYSVVGYRLGLSFLQDHCTVARYYTPLQGRFPKTYTEPAALRLSPCTTAGVPAIVREPSPLRVTGRIDPHSFGSTCCHSGGARGTSGGHCTCAGGTRGYFGGHPRMCARPRNCAGKLRDHTLLFGRHMCG